MLFRSNYLEIHNWIKALGKPKDFEQYKILEETKSWTGDGIYSDISVMVLSSTKMANYEIVFVDAFPTRLGDVVFDSTDNDVTYVTCDADFKYTLYEIEKIY